ncbi:hypothetical protein AUK45_00825 [Candidatus Peregrinibacteria bacterium CG2_30_44_17]|nr:MAG: hypothetical protein AUK45_00825 [Candidatus Peregrinibacteria bacterium CG2_30_44_17]
MKPEMERSKDVCFFRIIRAVSNMIDRSGLGASFVRAVSAYAASIHPNGNSVDVAELIHRRIYSFLVCEYFEWTFDNSQGDAPKFFWDGVRDIFSQSGLNFDDFLDVYSDRLRAGTPVDKWIRTMSNIAREPYVMIVTPLDITSYSAT